MTENQPASAGVDAEVLTPVDAPVAETTNEGTEQVANDEPKTNDENRQLQNKLARENRRIGKLTAQKYQFQQEAEQLRTKLAEFEKSQGTQNGAPDINKFTDFNEYQRAVARHEAKQEFAEREKATQGKQQEYQKAEWKQERESFVAEQLPAAKAAFSDFDQTIGEYSDVLSTIDQSFPAIQEAFLEADNAPLALYMLAKEGKLESLLSMSPTRAAAEIAKAEIRASQLAKTKPVTKTPAPLSPNKGTASSGKSLDSMSGAELVKWLRA